MKKKLFKKVLSISLGFLLSGFAFSESFEFVDRDIGEILYAVSLFKGFPISADDTVLGKANFRCAGEDFDEDFESFLNTSRLYVEKNESRWTVSKIRFLKDEFDNFSLDAFDVSPSRLFESIAQKTGLCVTYENLPQTKISIHTGFCSSEEIVKRVCALCPGFDVQKENSGFYKVSRKDVSQNITKNGKAEFSFKEDGWNCDIQNASLSFVAEKFCSIAEKQYCFSLSGESRIARAFFKAKTFDEALSKICLQGGAEFVKDGEIYFLTTAKNKNKINETGKTWRNSFVKNVPLKDFLSICSKRFPSIETLAVGNDSFVYLSDDSEKDLLEKFQKEVDVKNDSKLVQLKYIRTSEFLSNLPPFIEKSSVSDTGRGDSFYFTGSESAYKNLISHIDEIDKPVSRISYDLLIMQYQENEGSEWNPSLKASRLSYGDSNAISTQIGSVLDFNLDVVSAFGMKFAAGLQAAVSKGKAKVYADTTLNGVSGSTISFQNTNTYRYRDNNLDPDSGKPIYSGITKEITSGLKLEVTGIVTGDGMITSKITASVSRQGTDLSSTTGNPPPSSEKVVTTEVRAKSGEPVVLSGLIQEEENEATSGIPLLSKIPLLGNLFKSKEKSKEKTELVIYLVPSAEIFKGEKDNERFGSKKDYRIKAKETEKMKVLFAEFCEEKRTDEK